jgi:acetoin utilization deacetylase AcuC-like enzyme
LVSVRCHPDCLLHRPPIGHPEIPARAEEVLREVEEEVDNRWTVDRVSPLPPAKDIEGVLAWVHDPGYIVRVREAAEAGHGWLDSHDCVVSAGTYRAALAASGLALAAALDLVNGRLERGFVAARPPSHHAERDRARGFCFFNAVALAAEVMVRSWGAPVLIVDFDALHGNGTQSHFYERADVGYLSVHRYPWFPGSGTADEIGEGDGRGTTRNVPMAAGADDDLFCTALEHGLDELATRLRPAALVVSAGFSAADGDPVGGMHVTEAGFRRITTAVVQAAEAWAGGRVLSILEGGFDPQVLARSARAHVEELTVGHRPTSGDGNAVN